MDNSSINLSPKKPVDLEQKEWRILWCIRRSYRICSCTCWCHHEIKISHEFPFKLMATRSSDQCNDKFSESQVIKYETPDFLSHMRLQVRDKPLGIGPGGLRAPCVLACLHACLHAPCILHSLATVIIRIFEYSNIRHRIFNIQIQIFFFFITNIFKYLF